MDENLQKYLEDLQRHRKLGLEMTGRCAFENYIDYNNGEEPEHYFEEVYGNYPEEDKKIIWRIFINSLVCLRG